MVPLYFLSHRHHHHHHRRVVCWGEIISAWDENIKKKVRSLLQCFFLLWFPLGLWWIECCLKINKQEENFLVWGEKDWCRCERETWRKIRCQWIMAWSSGEELLWVAYWHNVSVIISLLDGRVRAIKKVFLSLLPLITVTQFLSLQISIDFFSLSLSSFSVCKQEKQQFQHLTNFFLPSLNITPINMESEREKSFFMAERWKLTISTSNTRKTREQERKKRVSGCTTAAVGYKNIRKKKSSH